MANACAGGHDDTVAGQVEAPTHVQAIAEGSEGGIESANGLVCLCAQEHAGGTDAQDVGRAVVLALVDFIVADPLEAACARGREDTEFEQARPVPADLFRADGPNGLAHDRGLDKLAQALGLGC